MANQSRTRLHPVLTFASFRNALLQGSPFARSVAEIVDDRDGKGRETGALKANESLARPKQLNRRIERTKTIERLRQYDDRIVSRVKSRMTEGRRLFSEDFENWPRRLQTEREPCSTAHEEALNDQACAEHGILTGRSRLHGQREAASR